MTTDQQGFEDLLEAFGRLHPGITLEFRRPASSDLHANFLQDVAAGRPTADILISSAMDLQFKLVNDGFAQVYAIAGEGHTCPTGRCGRTRPMPSRPNPSSSPTTAR